MCGALPSGHTARQDLFDRFGVNTNENSESLDCVVRLAHSEVLTQVFESFRAQRLHNAEQKIAVFAKARAAEPICDMLRSSERHAAQQIGKTRWNTSILKSFIKEFRQTIFDSNSRPKVLTHAGAFGFDVFHQFHGALNGGIGTLICGLLG